MVKKILETLAENGLVLMITGFLMAVISLLVYMQTRFYGSAVPRIAFGCTIAGFVIYVLGRFFMANSRRKLRTRELDTHKSEDHS